MACRASIRSWRSSPIPTRIPVVNGIWSSPAASMVASRRSGVLSGALRWHSRSPRKVSIIIPWLGLTGRSWSSSSAERAPALACGSSPVSSNTSFAIAATYSTVDENRGARRATGGRRRSGSSGRSPSVNSASWQPALAPCLAIFNTSVGLQVQLLHPGRWLGEGAVAAAVVAQHGEGDEDLGAVGDPVAVGQVAQRLRPRP